MRNYRYSREKRLASMRECQRNRAKRARDLCIQHYGSMCICCGENNPMFLSLDHIDGGGNIHRRESKIGNLAIWACANAFPASLQMLCYNCNLGKARNKGMCPHLTHLDKVSIG